MFLLYTRELYIVQRPKDVYGVFSACVLLYTCIAIINRKILDQLASHMQQYLSLNIPGLYFVT